MIAVPRGVIEPELVANPHGTAGEHEPVVTVFLAAGREPRLLSADALPTVPGIAAYHEAKLGEPFPPDHERARHSILRVRAVGMENDELAEPGSGRRASHPIRFEIHVFDVVRRRLRLVGS